MSDTPLLWRGGKAFCAFHPTDRKISGRTWTQPTAIAVDGLS